MLKAKCIECSKKGFATFYFQGKQPKINEYYHLEEQSGKSLELNGLFHSIIQEFYYWMFNQDTYIFNDGGITYDFRCSHWNELKDLLKQNYGEGNVYKYVNDKYQMKDEKDFYQIPLYAIEDFNNGNTERIKLVLKSWRDYTEKQGSRLVDRIFKIMDKLGVNTPKYLQIKEYLENKEIENLKESNYIKNMERKFKGEVIE